MKTARGFAILGLLAGAVWGQTAAFEVATIKPAQTPDVGTIVSGKFHAGVNIDGARVDIGFLSLQDLIVMAYEVKPFQVSGPDWMKGQRFDIVAKLPDGATKDQVPEMMQALLAERFKLAVHRENREHPFYALVQGKDGAKLKESPPNSDAADAADATDAPAASKAAPDTRSFSIGTGDGQVTVTPGGGRGGAVIRTSQGGIVRMAPGPDGTMQMQASRMSMAALAEYLTRMLDRPVLDRTGLKGNYDVALDMSISDLMQAASAAGVMIGGGPGRFGGGAGRIGGAPPNTASDPAGGSIFSSVQKLGLKLEPRKEPVDTVVVDHVEKNPTEN